jgi:DNA polymerase-3 subunit chi
MRVDFYQLGSASLEQVVSTLAEKLLEAGERLLVVASDQPQLARIDRVLWDLGSASFLPHGVAGTGQDSRQPVLLSTTADASNLARNLLIADGNWREAALTFNRAFYLFDQSSIGQARDSWKALRGNSDVERHYWAQEEGRWVEKT